MLFFPRTLMAGPEDIFIDPSDPSVIRETEIPFQSKILLRASDLPQKSAIHSPVEFHDQYFTQVVPNPQGTELAIAIRAGSLTWSGIYHLDGHHIDQLSLHFDSESSQPYWSPDGKLLVVQEEDSSHRIDLEFYGQEDKNLCVLNGKSAKSKFLNLSEPWWNAGSDRIFFKAEISNAYRNSLGLKSIPTSPKIGEATPECQKVLLHPVAKFMAENPGAVLPPRVAASLSEVEGQTP